MTSAVARKDVFALYRSLLRASHALPVNYLRVFFHLKAGDTVRAIVDTRSDKQALLASKFKRAHRDLRTLHLALTGRKDALDRLLNEAYGRSGKLRHEIMQPLLTDPAAPLSPRIIPAVESSRPPVYFPELTALLTSPHSRTTKPLDRGKLRTPPTLPPRADPASEEAKMLGPLSKRREVNIRWRYFTTEWKKVLAPLELRIIQEKIADGSLAGNHPEDVARVGARPIGLQGAGVHEQAEAIAGPPYVPRPTPRRMDSASTDSPTSEPLPSHTVQASRRFRRAYRRLLGRMPILSYKQDIGTDGEQKPKYEVSLFPSSVTTAYEVDALRLPEADESDIAWLRMSEESSKSSKSKRRDTS